MFTTTTCPLRISLVGGSTDHPFFLEKYKKGMVISFPSNLKTYVTIHKDIFGINTINKKYILNYSKREEVDTISQINNELIRVCFEELSIHQINLFLTSDVPSYGSGLASSSAYLMSLIKSIYATRNESITESEICKLALKIEKKFNPLVGQQDFWGSMPGLKKITFHRDSDPEIKYLDTTIFKEMDMYLIYTGIMRNSTDILKTLDVDKIKPLLNDVVDLENSIINNDIDLFHYVINRTWANKKNTSDSICSNDKLMILDDYLTSDENILSHKLLGAGNGGYFLIFTKKNIETYILNRYTNITKVTISENGLSNFKI